MVEKDKDSLKKSLAKSLLHTQGLTEELGTTQAQNSELVRRVAALEEEIEKVRTLEFNFSFPLKFISLLET